MMPAECCFCVGFDAAFRIPPSGLPPLNNTRQTLDERRQEVLAFLGRTLLLVQMAEKVIKFCMTYVLQKQAPLPLSLELLEKQAAEEVRKTLGYFLSELRKRISLEEQFDEHLRQFLDLRNQFIHRLDTVEGLDFETAEGLAVATAYIGRVAGLADYVTNIFVGLMRAWLERIGITGDFAGLSKYSKEEFAEISEYFQKIDQTYKPAVDILFLQKE